MNLLGGGVSRVRFISNILATIIAIWTIPVLPLILIYGCIERRRKEKSLTRE